MVATQDPGPTPCGYHQTHEERHRPNDYRGICRLLFFDCYIDCYILIVILIVIILIV